MKISILTLLSLTILGSNVPAATNFHVEASALSSISSSILSLSLVDGKVEYGEQQPYVANDADAQHVWKRHGSRFVHRSGRDLGALVGPNTNILMTFDRLAGARLDWEQLDASDNYQLFSLADPNFKTPASPIAVYRKTRPVDMARIGRWAFDAPLEHRLYLAFKYPLQGARLYELRFGDSKIDSMRFRFDPFNTVSEAIHISQIGFHPEDSVKVAYLSAWLGSGGGHTYPRSTRFSIIDVADERTVFVGETEKRLSETSTHEDAYDVNYCGADVHILDFSSFKTPGQYRLFLDGVGCSESFRVASNVWENAFTQSARGLLHQRSGVALDSQWVDNVEPRAFHPDDHQVVLHSDCSLMDSGKGLNARGSDRLPFGNLNLGRTDQMVSNAWGGYCDAGDWGRRIQHLDVARLLFELFEVHPDYFSTAVLRIPELTNSLPDVVDEALWSVDFFRRLQTADGGIRGGIDSAAYPRFGEASWQESLPVMAYAPGMWSSYLYAGVAARAARCLTILNHPNAFSYLDSALRAMAYAEGKFTRHPKGEPALPHALHDARNLAAAELYRTTGGARWNALFLGSTAFTKANVSGQIPKVYDQRHAAFVYASTSWHSADEKVRENARASVKRDADGAVRISNATGFGWTKESAWVPLGKGVVSTPQVLSILRAHALSGDKRYLRAALMATQCGAGANPLNLSFTTGVGKRWPQQPLHINARMMKSAAPTGLTVFGPLDINHFGNHMGFELIERFVYPPLKQWPVMECYFDVYMFPAMCEFSVHETIAKNVFAWGYLAAAKR
ncbi:MAG: endoglucanase [Kiritimatiellia bacterium]|jgi:endoglucanase